MNVKFIITCTHDEYMRFYRKYPELVSDTNTVYVGDAQSGNLPVVLKGVSNPSGYFYGRWYLRDDLFNIFIQLKMQTDDKSRTKRLTEIYELGMQKRKEYGKN